MILKRTVHFTGKSPYGTYKVVDMSYNGRPARMLFGDSASPQSGAALDDEPELLFDYNQRLLEMVMSQLPKRLLVIGGGAFMLPIAAFRRFPKMSIDVIEIDSFLVAIARDFFHLPESKRLRVHVQDGAAFVQKTKRRYEFIAIDAFSGFTIPPHLYQRDTVQAYKKRLSKNGVVAMNFISEYRQGRPSLAHELVAAFGEVFAHVTLYQADADCRRGSHQNMLLAASDAPLSFDYLQSTELPVLGPVLHDSTK